MVVPYDCIVVADGLFPSLPMLLNLLRKAKTTIACDGAALTLHNKGIIPTAIVGDMDSLPNDLHKLYADRIYTDSDFEINDLTKAVHFAKEAGHANVLILGATGLREDHTLGNISLLMDYAPLFDRIEMASDFGLFTPILQTTTFPCQPGQQISFFSMKPGGTVTTHHLRYPLYEKDLTAWWQGTLNEALGSEFTLNLSPDARLMVYRLFPLED